MNAYFIFGAVAVIIALVMHRLYKRLGRRCCIKGCGKLKVDRVSFIILPLEEISLSFPLRSPTSGKPRWWIRRVVTLTFSVCRNHGMPIRRLEKIDKKPISLWHARWAKRFHREQFGTMPMEFKLVLHKIIHQLDLYGTEELAKDATDTPDIVDGLILTLIDQEGGEKNG